jgi:predicted neuraminidase
VRLPDGILGPIRAKPVELADGTLLAGSSTEHAGWVVHMERATPGDLGSTSSWWRSAPLNDPKLFEAIQPTILVHSAGRLQILCRSRQQVVTEAWSDDAGRTWSPMTATALPNPSAGIDSVRLADGRFLLVYNPVPRGRSRLEIAVSGDGKGWRRALTLEDSQGEYSYPAIIQARDGRVHATYTWRRERIKHVVVDPGGIE